MAGDSLFRRPNSFCLLEPEEGVPPSLGLLMSSRYCGSAGFVSLFAFFLESFAHLPVVGKLEPRSIPAGQLTGGGASLGYRGTMAIAIIPIGTAIAVSGAVISTAIAVAVSAAVIST